MPSKTILVTGATDGIGKQTALDLAKMQYHVIVHGRDLAKAQSVAQEIKKVAKNPSIDFVAADFASLEQVRKMAGAVHQQYPTLDVLVNNAGLSENEYLTTHDGFEMTFGVNYLAPFLLTLLLLDLLKKDAPSRIVNVASMAHARDLDFENLQGEKSFHGYGQYATSKLCNILFTFELADRLRESKISVNCLHPGVIDTKLLRKNFGAGMGSPVTVGSQTSVFLATSSTVEDVTGTYFVDKKPSRPAKICYDMSVRKKLWNLSEDLVGLKFSDIKMVTDLSQ